MQTVSINMKVIAARLTQIIVVSWADETLHAASLLLGSNDQNENQYRQPTSLLCPNDDARLCGLRRIFMMELTHERQ